MAKSYFRFGVGRVRVLSTSTLTTRLTMILILQTHLPCRRCAYGNIPTSDCGLYNAVVTVLWCKSHSDLFSEKNLLHLLRLYLKLKDERRNDNREQTLIGILLLNSEGDTYTLVRSSRGLYI